MYLDRVKFRLSELGTVRPEEILPCTRQEVTLLANELGIMLPAAYVEFLLWAGHGAGRLMLGSDCFYGHLSYLKAGALRILREDGFPGKLPDDAFVFCMHQGYQFSFLRVSEGEDPPVYYYLEDSEQADFKRVFDHFSDSLMAAVESTARWNSPGNV